MSVRSSEFCLLSFLHKMLAAIPLYTHSMCIVYKNIVNAAYSLCKMARNVKFTASIVKPDDTADDIKKTAG